MVKIWQSLRAISFYSGLIVLVILMVLALCVVGFVPFRYRQICITTGNKLLMSWLRITCGVRINVRGLENIPASACVVLSNHQSTWETFFLQYLFVPASMILKRELLWIPLFGWGLYFMRAIAIKRSNPAGAIRQVLKQGKQRLAEGINVVIFPEGTRVRSAEVGTFMTSGAALAKSAGVQILPVRHDAGHCWPANSWLKTPGTINLVIGAPIDTAEGNPRELTEQAHRWIAQAL
ncbi:MAG: lysophospholipid acyltransferase family protein [Porticoccaceae bacterium]|jgi:1-acyl-sn-glycerol-3-phosphate acyltransferase|nr:lysophospholipid acyltransferase family protein [Porticoccaceae bacterium]